MTQSRMITVSKISDLLGCSREHAQLLCRTGKLKGAKKTTVVHTGYSYWLAPQKSVTSYKHQLDKKKADGQLRGWPRGKARCKN